MTWVEIRQSGEFLRHLPAIWRREQAMPKWFKRSSQIWTPTFPTYLLWALECSEIFGLFTDDGRFLACVYIERQDVPHIAVVHFGVAEKVEIDVLAAEFAKLRDQLFHRGVRYIRGWILMRNLAFVRLMAATGFRSTPSGLKMRHGEVRGRVLRWELMEARAA